MAKYALVIGIDQYDQSLRLLPKATIDTLTGFVIVSSEGEQFMSGWKSRYKILPPYKGAWIAVSA
jgi:hypothetical protein